MNQLSTFINMGGFGEFIWPAFGISVIVLAGVFLQSQRFLNRSEKELSALQNQENSEDMAEKTGHEVQK